MTQPLLLSLLFVTLCSAQSKGPVVLELFTSEGCSSCPPADNVVAAMDGKMAPGQVEMIVLGEHVDYWDNLGWKDRFSSPLFSARQQDYGIALRSGNIYTPQVVIDGQKEVLGSDARAISKAVSELSRAPRATVEFRLSGRDSVHVSVSHLPSGATQADVLLAVTETGLDTIVTAGENAGRRLRHAPVVHSVTRLAELDASRPGEYTADAHLNFRNEWVRSSLKLVLLVQDRHSRRILGSAWLKP